MAARLDVRTWTALPGELLPARRVNELCRLGLGFLLLIQKMRESFI